MWTAQCCGNVHDAFVHTCVWVCYVKTRTHAHVPTCANAGWHFLSPDAMLANAYTKYALRAVQFNLQSKRFVSNMWNAVSTILNANIVAKASLQKSATRSYHKKWWSLRIGRRAHILAMEQKDTFNLKEKLPGIRIAQEKPKRILQPWAVTCDRHNAASHRTRQNQGAYYNLES